MQHDTAVGSIVAVGAGGVVLRCDSAGAGACGLAVGGHLTIRAGGRWLLAAIRETRFDEGSTLLVTVDLLGEGAAAAHSFAWFARSITRFPCPGALAYPIAPGDLARIACRDRAQIALGTLYPTDDVAASLDIDALLGKHFALLGSTGSGKSSAAALILHRVIAAAPQAAVILLDPHGEYGRAFAETGVVLNVGNLALPYWLINFDEHCEVFVVSDGAEGDRGRAILAGCLLAARARSVHAAGVHNLTVDSPVPYLIFELVAALDAHMGKLDHAAEIARHVRLKNRIDEVLREPRFRFMFDRSLCADSLPGFLARILRQAGDGRPLAVIDLSGMPADIVSVVVALLARIVMDHAIWAQRKPAAGPAGLRGGAPLYPGGGAGAVRQSRPRRRQTSQRAARALERIANEGRKYGVALALVSQRPSDVAPGALSQFGTIVTMRLNNEADQACMRNAMPEGGRGLLDTIPALRRGEAVVCGEGAAMPMRIRFDTLAPALRPRSDDPSFAAAWATPAPGDGALAHHRAGEPVRDPGRGSSVGIGAIVAAGRRCGAGAPRGGALVRATNSLPPRESEFSAPAPPPRPRDAGTRRNRHSVRRAAPAGRAPARRRCRAPRRRRAG